MHGSVMVTNLHAKKCCDIVLKYVAKNFQCCNHRLCFLQCDWQLEILHRKQLMLIKPEELAQTSPDPLLLCGSVHETRV